jgi:hypothetical protein
MNTALHAHPRDIPNRPLETAAGRAFLCSGAPLRGFEAEKKEKSEPRISRMKVSPTMSLKTKDRIRNRREIPTISMKIKGLLIISHDLNEKKGG